MPLLPYRFFNCKGEPFWEEWIDGRPVRCNTCLDATENIILYCLQKPGHSFDVNQHVVNVYHSLETGGGYEGLASLIVVL